MIENLNNTLEERFGQLLTSVDSNVDWRSWFYANGLPSWRFKNYLSRSIADDFEKFTKAEDLKHQQQVLEYKLLHKRFEENGFSAILFKSCGYPTEFPYYLHGNLDVLIKRENLRAARTILDDLRYVELKHIEEPEKFLYKKFENGEAVSEIHLHTTVGWGVPFLCDEAFWKRAHRTSIENAFVHYPSNTDSLLITLAHSFYEDKSFSMANILRIAACLTEEVEWDYALWTARKRGWADGLREALGCYVQIIEKLGLVESKVPEKFYSKNITLGIADHLSDYPLKYSFLKGKKYYYRKVWKDTQRGLKQQIYDTVSTFCWGVECKLNLFFQKPFVVAFSGIDGCGKSAQCAALQKAFENCAIKTETIWFRCFCSPLSKFLQKDRKFKCSTCDIEEIGEKKSPTNENLNNVFLSFVERIYAALELLYVYAVKVRVLKLFDRVVILDRCLLDMGVELNLRYSNYTDSSLWRFLTWCSVKPDIHIFLDVDIAMADKRQSDESLATLLSMKDGYQNLINEYDIRAFSARKPLAFLTNEICWTVIKEYFKSWDLLSKKILFATRKQMNPSLCEKE